MPSPFDSTYDCIIVGAGPAGLTCAIFLGRYRRRVLVCHNGKPRNYASRSLHGFLGQHGIAPTELHRRGCDEARAAGVEICECTVTGAARNGDVFEVATSKGKMCGRRLVLAYGVRDILPDIPGIEEFYGRGVYHCPDCDGFEVSDRRIGVIGWGKRAVGFSLQLLQWTDDLTIFTDGRDREFDAEMTSKLLAEGICIKDEKVLTVLGGKDAVEAAVLSSGERVPIDALFFTVGIERSCTLAEDLGCEVYADAPNVVVNPYKETTVEGCYAVGDLVAGAQLAITSAADGAVAAIAINRSLLPPARIV